MSGSPALYNVEVRSVGHEYTAQWSTRRKLALTRGAAAKSGISRKGQTYSGSLKLQITKTVIYAPSHCGSYICEWTESKSTDKEE